MLPDLHHLRYVVSRFVHAPLREEPRSLSHLLHLLLHLIIGFICLCVDSPALLLPLRLAMRCIPIPLCVLLLLLTFLIGLGAGRRLLLLRFLIGLAGRLLLLLLLGFVGAALALDVRLLRTVLNCETNE